MSDTRGGRAPRDENQGADNQWRSAPRDHWYRGGGKLRGQVNNGADLSPRSDDIGGARYVLFS